MRVGHGSSLISTTPEEDSDLQKSHGIMSSYLLFDAMSLKAHEFLPSSLDKYGIAILPV